MNEDILMSRQQNAGQIIIWQTVFRKCGKVHIFENVSSISKWHS
jgi:hypothetical protein